MSDPVVTATMLLTAWLVNLARRSFGASSAAQDLATERELASDFDAHATRMGGALDIGERDRCAHTLVGFMNRIARNIIDGRYSPRVRERAVDELIAVLVEIRADWPCELWADAVERRTDAFPHLAAFIEDNIKTLWERARTRLARGRFGWSPPMMRSEDGGEVLLPVDGVAGGPFRGVFGVATDQWTGQENLTLQ